MTAQTLEPSVESPCPPTGRNGHARPAAGLADALGRLAVPLVVRRENGGWRCQSGAFNGVMAVPPQDASLPVAGYAPPLLPESLGDASFRHDHGLRYAYVAGAMANGIASVELVEAMAKGGMLGFFGAAGLGKERVEAALHRLQTEIPGLPFGVNLIHSPNESSLEDAVARMFIQRGLRLIEASAYLRLTLPVVRYRVAGIHRDADGQIVTPNRIVAKVSRVEVATQFFSPPPAEMLNELVRTGELTAAQAALAAQIPVAQDVTAEADSAGHTDNRPLVTLLPTLLALRDRLQAQFNYAQPLRVGAAGGLSTPSGLAAAFAMGAAYVVTGTVNQACVESGSSDTVRKMLAQAEQADTAMAPAADMFEMGVKLQVLKRGTMFPMRAAKLWELYRAHPSLEAIPEADRAQLEKQYFRATMADTWASTREFWLKRDPAQVERAERDPKHRMALVFRSYLGLSSRWANAGEPSRVVDYQVWCGPAMGAFNEWTRGTFLAQPENRRAAEVALNLLYGAAVHLRALTLRLQGVPLSPEDTACSPIEPERLRELMNTD
jgi:trans-AT polyketide synthase, acyltransferase and oxidoreductase domains